MILRTIVFIFALISNCIALKLASKKYDLKYFANKVTSQASNIDRAKANDDGKGMSTLSPVHTS